MELVLIWFVLSILVGVFANNRGRSGILYFLLASSIVISIILSLQLHYNSLYFKYLILIIY
jgi:hypothetical protein